MNLIGEKFGRLTVAELIPPAKGGRATYRCTCECGGEVRVRPHDLTRTDGNGIGRCPQCKVAKGKRYGHLVAVKPTAKRASNGAVVWLCRCDCGRKHEVASHNLSGTGSGKTKSCGKCKQALSGQPTPGGFEP